MIPTFPEMGPLCHPGVPNTRYPASGCVLYACRLDTRRDELRKFPTKASGKLDACPTLTKSSRKTFTCQSSLVLVGPWEATAFTFPAGESGYGRCPNKKRPGKNPSDFGGVDGTRRRGRRPSRAQERTERSEVRAEHTREAGESPREGS